MCFALTYVPPSRWPSLDVENSFIIQLEWHRPLIVEKLFEMFLPVFSKVTYRGLMVFCYIFFFFNG